MINHFADGTIMICPASKAPCLLDVPGYESLASVLYDAFKQASAGKGHERHAQALPFEDQPMQQVCDLLGSNQFAVGQAMKKLQEAQRLPHEAAVREMLGAINYIAGAVIHLELTRDG